MKIAILSMQKVLNFGSVLQAYSLKEIIKDITGTEPAFIDIDYTKCVRRLTEKPNDNTYKRYTESGIIKGIKRKVFRKKRYANEKKIAGFIENELNASADNNDYKYDYVVVGSDEVFNNTNNADGLSLQLYGDIPQAKKAFTYAAAAGSASYEDIPANDIESVRAALSNYMAISVRDDSTKEYISKLYNGTIEHHLDPVLVGPLKDRVHKEVKLKDYMIVYSYNERMRNPEEIKSIKEFAKRKQLKTVAIGGVQFWCDMYLSLDPFEVLDYFYHADYVVTDTFHGTIFSIINQANFASFIRKSNVSKMTGLLSDLGLEERAISSGNELERILSKKPDYSKTNQILESEKVRTRDYLRNKLRDEDRVTEG